MAESAGRDAIRNWSEALERLHAGGAWPQGAPVEADPSMESFPAPGEAIAEGTGPSRQSQRSKWERAFAGYERMLSLHERMVSELLSSNPSGAPGAGAAPADPVARRPVLPQGEIHIVCPERGRSGGRFGLAGSALRGPLLLVPGWFREVRTGREAAVALSVDPPDPAPAAGETRRIRIGIDLSGSEVRAGEALDGFLDVRGEGGALLRIWIRLEVTPGEGRDGHG